MTWQPHDLDTLAAADASEGAADIAADRRVAREATRMAAGIREKHLRRTRDDMRQMACALLLSVPLTHRDVVEAQRYSRAAARVEEWRSEAWWRAVDGRLP